MDHLEDLRRPSLGRESNIKMNLRNAGGGGGGMNCIDLAEDRDRDGLL